MSLLTQAMKKFSDWLVEGKQQAIYSGCVDRYQTSTSSNETLIQFLRGDVNNAIEYFVDFKTIGLVNQLKNAKAAEEAAQFNLQNARKINNEIQERGRKKRQEMEEQWQATEQKLLQRLDFQERHIIEQEEKINELKRKLATQGSSTVPPPPPPPSPPSNAYTLPDTTEEVYGGPYSPPKDYAPRYNEFNEVIDHLKELFYEKGDNVDQSPFLAYFEFWTYTGRTRKTTLLKDPTLKTLEGEQISFGYEDVGNSYEIFKQSQASYWFLIFYGPSGDYLTNIPNHYGHQIDGFVARNVLKETNKFIIFSIHKQGDSDKQLKSVLDQLMEKGFPILQGMVKNVLEIEDVKTYAREGPGGEDADLQEALRRSLITAKRDDMRREQEDWAYGAGGGYDESKMGEDRDEGPSLLQLQPRQLTNAERRRRLYEDISDFMSDLNITLRQQTTGEYRKWRELSIPELEKLKERLQRQFRNLKRNLSNWGDTY